MLKKAIELLGKNGRKGLYFEFFTFQMNIKCLFAEINSYGKIIMFEFKDGNRLAIMILFELYFSLPVFIFRWLFKL